MRIIESFTNWKNIIHVNEDLASAKTYMLNRYKNKQTDGSSDRLNTNDTVELTPEEKDAALLDPNYLKILKLTEPFPSLTLAFVKFHFDQNIPIKSGVLNLTNLANQLSDPATNAVIKALPKQISQYANQETGDQFGHGSGFEELTDQINKGIMKKSVYAEILDKIPNPLRSLIKSQPEDLLVKITNLMTQLSSLNKKIGEFIETDKDSPLFGQQTTVLKNFLLFISRNKNDTFTQFYKRLESIVTGLSSNKSQKIKDATSLEPQVKILYDKDNYLAFSIRTEEAQKKLCSEANWCINDRSFNTYASNAVQLNIINYNEPIATAKYITGTTINFDNGEVTHASDYNNISIKKSSNLETHLLNNGYPDEFVDSIVSQMPSEILIKTAIYKIGDSKSGLLEFIEKMIASTYRQTVTRSKNPVISKLNIDEIFEIMKPQIDKYLDKMVVINLYKKYGILSLDSVRIFKLLLLSNISEADKADIYSVTVSNFARIHKSAKLNISVLMPQLTKILAEEDQVKAELGISNSPVNEMVMAEPLTKPAPTETPTEPKINPNPRPSPIPSTRPFEEQEPAKADAADVIKRLNNLI